MEAYSIEQRVSLVKNFYKCGGSVVETQRKWSTAYKNISKPARSTILNLVSKFERTGSVEDDKSGRQAKPRAVRTPENIAAVKEIISNEPTASVSGIARRTSISPASTWRILRKDLQQYPYKIQILQRLDDSAISKRLEFAIDIKRLISTKELDPQRIIFSDEAHFWLDGYVNRQNYRMWGSEKPKTFQEKPLHPLKLSVWCGLSDQGIFGPYLFHSTIGQIEYQDMLKDQFFGEAQERGLVSDYWFQQDGATPHTAHETLKLLHQYYPGRVISAGYPKLFKKGLSWPPYSPDLNPLDFFFWGYVKDGAYKKRHESLESLAREVETVIESVSPEMCSRVIGNFMKRLDLVIENKGRHFENIIN